MITFTELGLRPEILKALDTKGYKNPTPIQAGAIPEILKGRDMLASAQTGTGKTAAFILPLLHTLPQANKKNPVRIVVLTPTRELAAQVSAAVQLYSRYLPVKTTELYGGVSMGPQVAALRKGVEIVIATPGRLQDHINRGNIDLTQVKSVVLDEADRMLDMGFLPAIEEIFSFLPESRQTLLFSATFAAPIRKLASRFLQEPAIVDLAPKEIMPKGVDQSAYSVDEGRKGELLTHLIQNAGWHKTLVFTRTKHDAEHLTRSLKQNGIHAAAIHGDKTQRERSKALALFKNDTVHVLVATDVAARGLDIERLPYVVNFDLPQSAEDYVHRIGRTGRAGATGVAVSFVTSREEGRFKGMQRFLQTKIPLQISEGFEPVKAPGMHKEKPAFASKRPRNGATRKNTFSRS